MENKQVTKQDFESLKKELFDNFARKQDLENQKTELLEKLVDKETHKQDLENLKKELLEKLVDKETHKQDLENLKRELLDKLVDKDTYKKDLAKLATKDLLRWEIHEVRKDLNDFKEETNQKLDMLLSAIDGLAYPIFDWFLP